MVAKRKTPVKTRNPDLVHGVGKYSRPKMYHKRGLWAIKAKNGGVFPHHDPKPQAPIAAEKPSKFYPTEDVKKLLINKCKPKPTKLRASITPGTVLILLAGRFMENERKKSEKLHDSERKNENKKRRKMNAKKKQTIDEEEEKT